MSSAAVMIGASRVNNPRYISKQCRLRSPFVVTNLLKCLYTLKNPKIWISKIITPISLKKNFVSKAVMPPKDLGGMAYCVDPDIV